MWAQIYSILKTPIAQKFVPLKKLKQVFIWKSVKGIHSVQVINYHSQHTLPHPSLHPPPPPLCTHTHAPLLKQMPSQ